MGVPSRPRTLFLETVGTLGLGHGISAPGAMSALGWWHSPMVHSANLISLDIRSTSFVEEVLFSERMF